MPDQVLFNGVLGPSAEARLREHLAEATTLSSYRFAVHSFASATPVRSEAFSPALCNSLGLDVWLRARSDYALFVRGMPEIRIVREGRLSPEPLVRSPDRKIRESPLEQHEAISWLVNLALERFTLIQPQSAHDRRAADRAQAARDAGDTPPSPLAFGELEIRAAMRVPYHERRNADFDRSVDLLHIFAAPETLSEGWGHGLREDQARIAAKAQ